MKKKTVKKVVHNYIPPNPDVFFNQCQFDKAFRPGMREKELTGQIQAHKYVSGDKSLEWRVASKLVDVRKVLE